MLSLSKYIVISTLASVAVIYHAFYTREQYFPSMVYLSTSKLAVAVLGNMAFGFAVCLYRLITKLFLGRLRESELERLNERVSSAIMETCLAMTIFREEFELVFVVMFATAIFVKMFHWLVQDRVDYLETTPNVSRLQHFRIVSFMILLMVVDVLFLNFTLGKIIEHNGKTVMLLVAFEYLIQISSIFSSVGKYTFAALDRTLEGHWESKGVYVFYLELMTDLFHLCVYLAFFCIVMSQYGLPIHLIRDLYWTIRKFQTRVRDFLRYRRVTSRMDLFPDATEEDLARCDNVCIICREEMTMATVNKKLPCGHVFHVHCLRSWLERQQNCPTCRSSVFPPRESQGQGQNLQNGRGQQRPPAQQEQDLPAAALLQNLNNQQQQGNQVEGGDVMQEQGRPAEGAAPGEIPAGDQAAPPPMQQRLPQWNAGQQQFGFVWNYPNVLPTTSMATFVNGQMQYAGQQNPEPVINHTQQGLHGVPIVPLVSSFSAPITLLSPSGINPERHQMAAAAAVAAAAYTPHAGLVMMPPVTYIPTSNSGSQSSEERQNTASTSAAQAAAAASAASGMAAAFSQSQPWNAGDQSTMDQTMQVLQRQLEFLQAHMTGMRTEANDQPSGSTSEPSTSSSTFNTTAFPTPSQQQDRPVTSTTELQNPTGEDPGALGLRRRRTEGQERQEDSGQ